jgi:hypothetical protein
MLVAWAGLTAASIAYDAIVTGSVIAVGPSNFSLCSGSSASGPSVVLFYAAAEGEEETGLHASLQSVAAEAYRRELRVRVCKARLPGEAVGSAGDVPHVDSMQWRTALSEVLGDAEADQLRALLRVPVSRVCLFRRGNFADFTSGDILPAHDGECTIGERCLSCLLANAGAEAHDLMDNLARYAVPAPAPGALLTLTASNFTRGLHAAPLMLVVFSVRWCARCAALSVQLHRAAILLPSLQPAIDAAIATIDMDDPQNAPLIKEVGATRCTLFK